MIKFDKNKIVQELEEKEKLIKLKLNSLDKQENVLNDKILYLREKVLN
jgi:chaperonin cofactor prefoldin